MKKYCIFFLFAASVCAHAEPLDGEEFAHPPYATLSELGFKNEASLTESTASCIAALARLRAEKGCETLLACYRQHPSHPTFSKMRCENVAKAMGFLALRPPPPNQAASTLPEDVKLQFRKDFVATCKKTYASVGIVAQGKSAKICNCASKMTLDIIPLSDYRAFISGKSNLTQRANLQESARFAEALCALRLGR